MQADRDPHRVHWLLELMAEEPLKGTDGSFQDARLAQRAACVLSTTQWTERIACYAHMLLCAHIRMYQLSLCVVCTYVFVVWSNGMAHFCHLTVQLTMTLLLLSCLLCVLLLCPLLTL